MKTKKAARTISDLIDAGFLEPNRFIANGIELESGDTYRVVASDGDRRVRLLREIEKRRERRERRNG